MHDSIYNYVIVHMHKLYYYVKYHSPITGIASCIFPLPMMQGDFLTFSSHIVAEYGSISR